MPGLDHSQIRFAQWRDPRLSVHPSRASPSIQQQSLAAPTYAPWMLQYHPPTAANDDELSEEDTAAAKAARKQKRKERRAKKAGMCKSTRDDAALQSGYGWNEVLLSP